MNIIIMVSKIHELLGGKNGGVNEKKLLPYCDQI